MKRLAGFALVLALSACTGLPSPGGSQPGWAGAWGASPTIPPAGAKTFENQTVRQVVRLSQGGGAVRIRFTNEYGEKPLAIGAATIAIAGADGKAVATPVAVTFGGQAAVTIPAGAPLLSDPVAIDVKALDSLSVSLFFRRPPAPAPATSRQSRRLMCRTPATSRARASSRRKPSSTAPSSRASRCRRHRLQPS